MSEREFTNERFSIMKQLIYFLTTVSVFTSCMGNQTTIEQNNVEVKPLTLKEKGYIKQLEKNGYFKIDMQPPIIGEDAYGSSRYHITINKLFKQTKNNFDSIKLINYEIAKELINDVLEDSIIYDLGDLNVILNAENRSNKNVCQFYETYYKKQLEKDLGFKVIKVKGGKYKRVEI